MATFVSGYINDLSPVKDNIKLRVRILRTWMQPMFSKPNIVNMEMIVFDEQNTRMQATVRMALVTGFKHQLEEGNAVILQRYSLGEIQPKFRIVKKPLRLSFLSNTVIEKCTDFTGSRYGFDFRPYGNITSLKNEEVGQFDVIGQVVACDDLDTYDKNGRSGKKKPITIIDAEGNELPCTLWGSFAQQFADFLNKLDEHGKIIAVLQLAMMKVWDGKMAIQNGFNGTRLFLFNGKDCIPGNEFKDVESFRKSLVAAQGTEDSQQTASRISTASKNSTKDDFVTKYMYRNIAEIFDVEQGVPSVIVATICAIQEEEGWWYLGCWVCRKKLVKSLILLTLNPIPHQNRLLVLMNGGAQNAMLLLRQSKPSEYMLSLKLALIWHLFSVVSASVPVYFFAFRFRLQVRVQDESGTVSVCLFNDEVQAILNNLTAYQLVDKYGKSDAVFPTEIMEIVDKKFVFKVAVDAKNKEKLMPVFNVLRLSNDPDIIKSVCATATPGKAENEATSLKVADVTPFDLESQTDENDVVNAEQSSSDTTSQEKRKVDPLDKTDLLQGEENSATKRTKLVLDKEIKVEKP